MTLRVWRRIPALFCEEESEERSLSVYKNASGAIDGGPSRQNRPPPGHKVALASSSDAIDDSSGAFLKRVLQQETRFAIIMSIPA